MSLVDTRIESASWTRLVIWFGLLFVFSAWAFGMDSPWTRALEAAQGELPETQPGFPPIEPQRSLSLLGDDVYNYITWQALDIPYIVMNLMVMSIALGIGLKTLGLDASPLRFLLVLPGIYVFGELTENVLLALFAANFLPPSEPLVLVQQLATTVKLTSGIGAFGIGALSLVASLIVLGIRRVNKKT